MNKSATKEATPMMQQWHSCKAEAKGAIVFFRLGDFYEAFYEDAALIAKELEITLTKRSDIPMSGVPAHAVDGYLEKLVEKGHLVAIAEQVEDAKKAKGLVKRAITRIISPATHLDSSRLPEKANNFFLSLSQVNAFYGIASLDLTTGEMFLCEVPSFEKALDEIGRRAPSEILVAKSFISKHPTFSEEMTCRVNVKDDSLFEHKSCYQMLTGHFHVHSLDGFGLKGLIGPINAAGALFSYLEHSLSQDISHIKTIKPDNMSSYLSIDRVTANHLEILHSQSGHKEHTLNNLLDQTKTPMGGRLLRRWVSYPLLDCNEIAARQDAIAELLEDEKSLSDTLKGVRDLERLTMKVSLMRATPRDLVALANSLRRLPEIRNDVKERHASSLVSITSRLLDLSHVTERILSCLVPEPPLRVHEGGVFQSGISKELDELRELKSCSHNWLASYQTKLREAFDIKTLKVNFNKAFGYFIEVSRGQSHKMPETFDRRQTLVNAERYISPELKEYEEKILGAEEKIAELEQSLFFALREEIATFADQILIVAGAIAELDTLFSLAMVALQYDYVRPKVTNDYAMHIEGGKHPVIENSLSNTAFVPNDTILNNESALMLITGPNMAGKSTYIRQVALLTIMAQIGSFIPAKSATIGVVDKVFSRIGASDDLSRGQSTFMVEMSETANILHNATERSLIILDEIGRGTSTYDGISIAWAVASHILKSIKAKTLFATHYFELTTLAKEYTTATCYRVAAKELEDTVVFLHKIEKGEADKSYGIHVAKLAGLPKSVITLAKQRLIELEQKPKGQKKAIKRSEAQLSLFPANEPDYGKLVAQIENLDLNSISPLEALNLIAGWKDAIRP